MFEHLSTPVRIVLLATFALLLVASAISIGLQRSRPDKNYTELRARVRTWWVIVALVVGALCLSPNVAVWFLAFVSFLAFKEFLSLVPSRRSDHRVLFWAYLVIPMQYYWVWSGWYGMFIVFIPIYVFLFLPARMIISGDTQGFLRAIGTLQWGVVVTIFFLSHAAYLLVMPIADEPRVVPVWQSEVAERWPGPGLFLLLLLLTQGNDVAQYIWGKSFGKRKISPTVSPGKTWAGFLGGLFTTVVIAGLVGPWVTMMSPLYATLAGALVAVTGIIGDLNISALKRDLGVKDSGTTLPGHGGILDRVDSLTFTAPVFFHFVWYCYG